MLDLVHSQIYAKPEDAELLKNEPEYVKERYFTIIKTMISAPFRWTRQQAADHLGFSKRHMQRLVKIYQKQGIRGLRHKSKCPKKYRKKNAEVNRKSS